MNYIDHYNKIKNKFYNFTINNKLAFKNGNCGYRECNKYCGIKYQNISLFPYSIISLKEILKCDSHYIFTIKDNCECITMISWKPKFKENEFKKDKFKDDLPRYQDLEISWINKIRNLLNLNK